MKTENEEFTEVIKKLNVLKSTEERKPQQIEAGKAAFLSQAAKMAETVSPKDNQRHKNWKRNNPINLFERRKERNPMLSTLTSIILAISLLLGGSGATVAAAQASVPGDLFYNIKLLSENAALDLTANPESQFEIALQLIDRRANEIQTLLAEGEMITNETQTVYRDQIEKAMLIALNLPEDKVVPAFETLQERLLTQQQTLSQTMTNGSADSIAAMIQTRDMLQERLRLLEDGISGLPQAMEQLQIQEQIQNPETGNSPTSFGETGQNTPDEGNGNFMNTNTPSMNNGNGQNNNPWITLTPSPLSTEVGGEGQNNTTGSGSPQGNEGNSTIKTETPNQGPNSGSGSQSGNH